MFFLMKNVLRYERFWCLLGFASFGVAFLVCVQASLGFGLGFHNMDLAYNKAVESCDGFGDWYDRVGLDESMSLSDLYIVGAGLVLRNFWLCVGSSFVFGFLFCCVFGLVWDYRCGGKKG